MNCPNCQTKGQQSRLETSRTTDKGRTVSRVKHCPICLARFSSHEILVGEIRDGSRTHVKSLIEPTMKIMEASLARVLGIE